MKDLKEKIEKNLVILENKRDEASRLSDIVYLNYLYGQIDAHRYFLEKLNKSEN